MTLEGALLHDSTPAQVGPLSQPLVHDTTASNPCDPQKRRSRIDGQTTMRAISCELVFASVELLHTFAVGSSTRCFRHQVLLRRPVLKLGPFEIGHKSAT